MVVFPHANPLHNYKHTQKYVFLSNTSLNPIKLAANMKHHKWGPAEDAEVFLEPAGREGRDCPQRQLKPVL